MRTAAVILPSSPAPSQPFSSAKSMTATAYTAGYGGAGPHAPPPAPPSGVGTVAVDQERHPSGHPEYIVTNDGSVIYGMAVASDTGVRGNKVDLYYGTYQQCINFGRRSCTVYILPLKQGNDPRKSLRDCGGRFYRVSSSAGSSSSAQIR